ncbi:MAG: hypothetical protein JWN40_1141 [Phycisphaerales bacterium]|nr:hypothetical protein [Phycisphaerales bacterium]
MFGRIVVVVLGSVLGTSSALGTLADDLRRDGAKINPCVRTYKSAGANDIVLLKFCTCMYRKMDIDEIQSIVEWEATHISERRACRREAGWK